MTRRSRKWVRGAFHVTTPSSWRELVCCTDECETCPLYLDGCSKSCVRWPDLICENCPCLASENAGENIQCVDPSTMNPIIDKPCMKQRVLVKEVTQYNDP